MSLQILGNSYIIIAELPVHWLASAMQIPRQSREFAMYPIWLMDSLGTRAAVFVRCPNCDSPLGLSPGTASEQQHWNKEMPEVHLMVGCAKCPATYLLRNDIAYCLSMLPPQHTHSEVPRFLVAKD